MSIGVVLLPAVATAQPISGLYVGAGIGANIAGTMTSAQHTSVIGTDVGPLGLVALGWGFGNGLRVEIEGSDRSNDIGGISTRRANGQTLPLGNAGGSVGTGAVMANVEYDIPLAGLALPVRPYIGAGLGYAAMSLNGAGGNGYAKFPLPGNNTFIGPDTVSYGSAGALAYQAIAGAALPLGVPGLEATLEYRFFGTARADVPVTRTSTAIGDTVNSVIPSDRAHDGLQAHDNEVLFGLRYRFGAL